MPDPFPLACLALPARTSSSRLLSILKSSPGMGKKAYDGCCGGDGCSAGGRGGVEARTAEEEAAEAAEATRVR
eukprot:2309581-Pleurochrysis_carterae.AAC.1